MNPIDKLLQSREDISEMMSLMEEASIVEKYNEGEYVMNEMMKNVPTSAIVRVLNKKHDTKEFNSKDIHYFMQRNPEIAQKLILKSNELMDSHIKTNMNHELALIKLYHENLKLLNKLKEGKDFDPKYDTENFVKITKNLHDLIMSDAKLRGRFKEGTDININLQAKEMVNQLVNQPTELQSEILNAMKKGKVIDVDTVIVNGSPIDGQ